MTEKGHYLSEVMGHQRCASDFAASTEGLEGHKNHCTYHDRNLTLWQTPPIGIRLSGGNHRWLGKSNLSIIDLHLCQSFKGPFSLFDDHTPCQELHDGRTDVGQQHAVLVGEVSVLEIPALERQFLLTHGFCSWKSSTSKEELGASGILLFLGISMALTERR